MKFYCTECREKLERHNSRKSKPRNETQHTEECFLQCNNCGNVMIAKYNKEIYDLNETPKEDNAETQEMIEEATELFKENGYYLKEYHFKKPLALKQQIEELTEKLNEVETNRDCIVDLLVKAIDKIKKI